MTNTSDKTIADKIDTSDEACRQACAMLGDAQRELNKYSHQWPSVYMQHADSGLCELADVVSALIRALCAERDEAKREVEICHARETCMCGDYVKHHNIGSGHSPVSMYDHALDQAEQRAKAAESELSSLRAGVSEEALRRGLCEHDHARGSCRCAKVHSTNDEHWCPSVVNLAKVARALLQSAPQDAKLAAPMEGEVAKVSREYVLSALRWREVSEFDGRGRNGLTIEQTAYLICNRLANALESLSRRNEGDGDVRLQKRPVAFRVVRPNGARLFCFEESAQRYAEVHDTDYQGLYVRDGNPPPPETAKETQR